MAKPILLYDTITDESAKDITEQILSSNEGEAVDLWLNSRGGSVTAGWAIIAAMQQREVNITVTGDADSMGLFMLAFANKVTVFDTTNALLHRAASFWEEVMTDEELKDIEARNKVIRKKLESKIDIAAFEKTTKKNMDDVFSMEDRLDVRLNARQLKKIGLADEVIKLDVKKKKEIESRYYADIAALAQPNINKNKKKMGILDKVFGKNDPALLAEIDGKKFLYSKLEQGETIKAIGEGEQEPINGTFEAKDIKATVVDNEIRAIEAIDRKDAKIEALTNRVEKLEKLIDDNASETVEAFKKIQAEQTKELEAITNTLDAAKLNVSSPELPKADFREKTPAQGELSAYDLQKKIDAQVKQKREGK